MIPQIEEEKKGFLTWLKESVTIKLAFIAFLILVLLIPSSLIENLITERSSRQVDMMNDVSDKWSGSQLIRGPVLTIPYKKHVKYLDNTQKELEKDVVDNLYVLPDNLRIKAELKTQILHRGIFDVVVYNTIVHVSGNFSPVDLSALSLSANDLSPEKARIAFSISDLKGLKTNPVINLAGQMSQATPIFDEHSPFSSGLQATINLPAPAPAAIPFDYHARFERKPGIELFEYWKNN